MLTRTITWRGVSYDSLGLGSETQPEVAWKVCDGRGATHVILLVHGVSLCCLLLLGI